VFFVVQVNFVYTGEEIADLRNIIVEQSRTITYLNAKVRKLRRKKQKLANRIGELVGEPSDSLPPVPLPSIVKTDEGTARADFKPLADGLLHFKKRDRVKFLKKYDGGWWKGELKGKRGWVPSTYFQE